MPLSLLMAGVSSTIMGRLNGVVPPVDPPVGSLAEPVNLFTPEQSAFDISTHVDGRGNWEVQAGRLEVTGAAPATAARLFFDAPLEPATAHYILVDHDAGTQGDIKLQLKGSTNAYNGNALTSDWQNFDYIDAAHAIGAHSRMEVKPDTTFDGSVDDVRVYNMSAVDPNVVVCDVVIMLGDSRITNTSSDLVTAANRETSFDPRIWYMPSLASNGRSYTDALAVGFRPMPAIEPVVGVASGARMTPCHAAAGELVNYSADRGRPLLILAVGEAGSGLFGSKGLWGKGATPNNQALNLYDELLTMKAALEGLGPAHEIIGIIGSFGTNDRFAGDAAGHEISRGPEYTELWTNIRADIADVPMVNINIAAHLTTSASVEMRNFLRRFDQDSGDARALDRFKVVDPVGNNPYVDPDDPNPQDPHENAVGVQAYGRLAGQALLSLFP